jgi:hypothetical protein
MFARTLKPTAYHPTLPRSGAEGDSLFRMKNLVLRGDPDRPYLECYGGSENLSETIPTAALTGTVATTAGSKTVTGTGTAFTTELRIGQFVLLPDAGNSRGELAVVADISSNTSFTASRAALYTGSGLTAHRLPVLFEVNKRRGTMIHGNVLELDKGTLLGVGDGTLRINGATLSASLTFSNRRPKLGVLAGSVYTFYTLGMNTPSAPTVVGVAGGSKNMQAGSYSLLACAARLATGGYNNPSAKVEFSLATAGDRPRASLPAPDTSNGHDAWKFFVSKYVGNNPSIVGPWFAYPDLVPVSALTDLDADAVADDTYLEWLDSELLSVLASADNDAPADAEFVATIRGFPIYVSCQGKGSTSPGPWVVPAKPGNIEAAPLELAAPTSPPETILGCVPALGRLFLLTVASLQVAQNTEIDEAPIAVLPFWKSAGFSNPYQVTFVNDTLYGNPASGPTRSSASGVEAAVQKDFAAPLEEFTRLWHNPHVLTRYDPKNDAVCFIHPAYSLNSAGYWTTRVWMFGLHAQGWVGDVVLESTTQDMIVCGAETVGDYLEFLAGGRTSGGTVSVGTYRFDNGSVISVNWYAAWQLSDGGIPDRDKLVKFYRVVGKHTSASLGIHGAGATEADDIATLEAGNSGSKSGSIALPDVSDVTEGELTEINVSELAVFTARVDGTWNGTGARDRLDKVLLMYEPWGARR